MEARLCRVHTALLLTQFCWGSAAVVNKLGLSGAGVLPLLFALVREALATPVLFGLLWVARRWPHLVGPPADAHTSQSDEEEVERTALHANEGGSATGAAGSGGAGKSRRLLLRLLPGFFIFVDQLCSLTGVALSDPISAAAWQPSQVVFTMLLCACLGLEALTPKRALGAGLTICGALCLVFLGSSAPSRAGANPQVGQIFFFCNCLASSLEVIFWRRLLKHASSPMAHFVVMAESYLVAACLMAVACFAVSSSRKATAFFCPECSGDARRLPPEALWAVAYAVIFQTIIGYLAQAWALRYAEPTLASLYATVQPIMAAAVTVAFLSCGFNPGGVLSWPGREMLGAVLIIAGLVVTQLGGGAGAARGPEATQAGAGGDSSEGASSLATGTGSSSAASTAGRCNAFNTDTTAASRRLSGGKVGREQGSDR